MNNLYPSTHNLKISFYFFYTTNLIQTNVYDYVNRNEESEKEIRQGVYELITSGLLFSGISNNLQPE